MKTYPVKLAIYKLVKKTQNQIRTQLIVQNLFVCFYCVSFLFIYLFFSHKNYEHVHFEQFYMVS